MPWTAMVGSPERRQALKARTCRQNVCSVQSEGVTHTHTWPTPGQEAAGPESRISRTWSWSCSVCRAPPSAADSCRQVARLFCHALQAETARQLLLSNLSSGMPGLRVTATRCSISEAVSLMHKLLQALQVCAAGHRHCRHQIPELETLATLNRFGIFACLNSDSSSRAWQTAAQGGTHVRLACSFLDQLPAWRSDAK